MAPSRINDDIHGDKPIYGKRLLLVLVDDLAKSDPSRVFASIPTSESYSTGLRSIDMATFARTIDRVSWWLEEQLGKATGFPTVAYLGPSMRIALPFRP